MAFENAEVNIIGSERVLDTGPELYKKRALEALEKEFYLDAMAEAEKAIKYGNNGAEYQIVKAKVLLAREEYNAFLVYIIRDTQLWNRRSILFQSADEELEFLLYGFSVCYGQLGYSPDNLTEIILTADGKGMCKTIQEAVDRYPGKKIFLTKGVYHEDVRMTETESKIVIEGSKCANTEVDGSWIVTNCSIQLENITFKRYGKRNRYLLRVTCSQIEFNNVRFTSDEKCDLRITFLDKHEEIIDKHEPLVGIIIEHDDSRIYNMTGCIIDNMDIGVLIFSPSVSQSKDVRMEKVKLENNSIGVVCLKDSACLIKSSNFRENRCAVYSFGTTVVEDSEISFSTEMAFHIGQTGRCIVRSSQMKKNFKLVGGDGAEYLNMYNSTEELTLANKAAKKLANATVGVLSLFFGD